MNPAGRTRAKKSRSAAVRRGPAQPKIAAAKGGPDDARAVSAKVSS
jgi:hypothetical protein